MPGGSADEPHPFRRTTTKNISPDPISSQQPGARFAHRIQSLQPELQPQRDLLRAGVLFRVLGQQQAGFEIGEPRRHHEIIGGDLELQRACLREVGEILLDQLENRDLREIDLLRAGEIEQKVERPLPPVERQGQLIRLADRPFLEIFVHRARISIAGGAAKAWPHYLVDN